MSLNFPTWKERHSGNSWHALNRRTWDLGSDTVYWQKIDSSYVFPLPQSDWVCIELNLIVHSLAFMEMHMNSCWPFVFPQCIHLLLFCMHTSECTWKEKNNSRTLLETVLTCSQTSLLTLLFLVKTLLHQVCIWLRPSPSSATITQLCQEVPPLSAQALPMLRGTRQGLKFFSCPLMWCLWVFIYFDFQHRALSWELDGRMRC